MSASKAVLTRSDCVAQLPAGSDPLIVELHLAITAADRHASRIEAATSAARTHLEQLGAQPTDRLTGALLQLEAGGVGGQGGYAGGATRRMSWASRLGKGRAQASDGDAWNAALVAAARALGVDRLTPALLRDAATVLQGDLEWPLAYALRCAAANRFAPEIAAEWADVARAVAACCEPDGDAGQLADRYGLRTLPRRRCGMVRLRAETIGEMLQAMQPHFERSASEWEAWLELGASATGRGLMIEVVSSHTMRATGVGPADPAWEIRIIEQSTPSEIADVLARGWSWVEGDTERAEFRDLVAQLWPGINIEPLLADWTELAEREESEPTPAGA